MPKKTCGPALVRNVRIPTDVKINFEPRTERQKELIKKSENHPIVFATGPAGVGKTLCFVALALRKLMNKEIDKIIITRPVVEAGENLGFLPGTFEEKLAPYLVPILESIRKFIPETLLENYIETKKIQIVPLAYTRGITYENAIVIVDEGQNCTYTQLKMILTRLGRDSRLFIDGDMSQIDLKPGQSGLETVMKKLDHISDIAYVEFQESDCQRHGVVSKIISAL